MPSKPAIGRGKSRHALLPAARAGGGAQHPARPEVPVATGADAIVARFLRSLPAVLLLGGLLASGLHALGQPRTASQFVQTILTDKNGLPQNSVNAIAQTTDGYLWFGTEEGLARFDGARVTVYDTIQDKALQDSFINAITPSRDGSLWIGTRSGLTRLQDGVFHTYLAARSPINTIYESREGAIWVGSLDGLYNLQGDRIHRYTVRDGLPSNGINSIAEGADGSLFFGTDKGLARLKGGIFHAYGAGEGLTTDSVGDIVVSRDGFLWIATTHGLLRWNGKVADTLPSLSWPPQARITSLFEGHDGRLWIGFDHSGLASLSHGEVTWYTTRQGLPSDDITEVFEDREGNLWAGLFEGGAVELRNSTFSTLGVREGLSEDMVWSVLQARDGSLWVGTNSKGLDHIDANGKVQVYGVRDGLPAGSVFALHESPDGSLWIGSEHGELSHLVHGRIAVFRDPLNRGARLATILEDASGDLLLGFHELNGLVRFHRGQFHHYSVPGLLNTAILAPDGSIWVGTDHGGVVHLDHGSVTSYTTREGLLSNFAQAVYIDRDGVVWAGTSPGGLNRIAKGRITTYSIGQGLFDLTVGAIVEDEFGNLWMTCNKGIYKVSKKELNDFAAGRIASIHSVVYGTVDGLRTAECNFAADPSVWKGSDGRLWFATPAGITSVDPAHSAVRTIEPSPLIEQVRFNRKLLPFEHGVTAGPGNGDVEIQFTAPDFVAPDRIRFRYRLRGFDPDWTEVGDRRAAIYTKLPPGQYVFEVQGGDGGQGWSSRTAELGLVLTPNFWQTRWFAGLCILLLVLFCFALYRLRVRYLVEHTRELEQKVNLRTAELRQAIKLAESAQHALRDQAMRDSLTKLWNRRAVLEMLEKELCRAQRERLPLAILMADLDHFKLVNDTYGHLTGDAVLQEIARRIQELIRSYDSAGRYGGEEFVIVLPGCCAEDGMRRAEEFRRAIADRPISTVSGALHITCSFGVALHDQHFSAEELIDRADEALYSAKRLGRNCVHAGA